MSRFTPIDLSAYPIGDLLEVLDHASYLARDKADFLSRWDALRVTRPDLPTFDTTSLSSEPVGLVLANHAYRELIWRGHINDKVRNLSLAGALGTALDHIGITYYRTPRLVVTPADPDAGTATVMELDEVYRQRLALAPESWSTCGPEGAYLFYGLSSSGDVLDLAVYSEDEGVCLAPENRFVILPRSGVDPAGLDATVKEATSRKDKRPFADLISAVFAEELPFDVDITLRHRPGASVSLLTAAAEQRVRTYCEGQLRWIGDGVTGPVFLVGRRFRQDTIAAAALVDSVVEVVVNSPSADVNVPDAGYTAALPIARDATEALDPALTAHLFRAPRVGTITINAEVAEEGWS